MTTIGNSVLLVGSAWWCGTGASIEINHDAMHDMWSLDRAIYHYTWNESTMTDRMILRLHLWRCVSWAAALCWHASFDSKLSDVHHTWRERSYHEQTPCAVIKLDKFLRGSMIWTHISHSCVSWTCPRIAASSLDQASPSEHSASPSFYPNTRLYRFANLIEIYTQCS